MSRRSGAALVAAGVLAVVGAGCGGGPPADDRASGRPAIAQAAPRVPPVTAERRERALPPADTGAWVRRPTALRTEPGGRVVAGLGPRTRFDGPQVLGVVARRGRWLGVLHPRLPNGRAGWVDRRDVDLVREPWAVEVDVSARRARVRLHGRVVDEIPVGVGRADATTPTGRFSVTDRIRPAPGSPYGCCVLALSGRQPGVPQGWVGGDRLALHGTTDPASIGRAASLGCVRVGETDLRRLFRRIPVGARVTIRR